MLIDNLRTMQIDMSSYVLQLPPPALSPAQAAGPAGDCAQVHASKSRTCVRKLWVQAGGLASEG